MQLLDLYRNSLDAFLARVRMVREDQWHVPTPCTEWDVRTLVNHMVYEERWSVPLFAGATIAEVGDRFEGDLLGDDPVAAATDAVAQARKAVSAKGVLDRTVNLSFGDAPATEYVRQLFADHLVHSWDLAAAIGADRSLDPRLVHACLEWFEDRAESYRRSGVIGPRVEVAPDASEQDRLLAGFGRDPDWRP